MRGREFECSSDDEGSWEEKQCRTIMLQMIVVGIRIGVNSR